MFKLIWLIRERIYWKRRAEVLEAKLDHERERNREHEDQILSRFVTVCGAIGVEARPAPPEKQATKPRPYQPPNMEEAMKSLTPYQQSMLALYQEEGAARGLDQGRIIQDFYNEHILGMQRITEVPQ